MSGDRLLDYNNVIAGERLKIIRESLGLKRNEMAFVLGVTDKLLQNYETGHKKIGIDFAKSIYDVYKANPIFLTFGIGEPILNKNLEDLFK